MLPRQVLPGQFYLITRRCTQRQFLLRPDAGTYPTGVNIFRGDPGQDAWGESTEPFVGVVSRSVRFSDVWPEFGQKMLQRREIAWLNVGKVLGSGTGDVASPGSPRSVLLDHPPVYAAPVPAAAGCRDEQRVHVLPDRSRDAVPDRAVAPVRAQQPLPRGGVRSLGSVPRVRRAFSQDVSAQPECASRTMGELLVVGAGLRGEAGRSRSGDGQAGLHGDQPSEGPPGRSGAALAGRELAGCTAGGW